MSRPLNHNGSIKEALNTSQLTRLLHKICKMEIDPKCLFDFTDESSEGRWYWTYSLQVANFTAWAQNEPDDGIMGDYASLKSDEYSWDDETPTSTAYPICQFFV